MPFLVALSGLGTGLSLIVAIGAQNAFVLRQGLGGSHVSLVTAICAISDLILISLGTAALDQVSSVAGWALPVMRVGGVVFLLWYGLMSARRAWTKRSMVEATDSATSVVSVVLTCLALTWLNPHVYLDTVLLLGSIAVSNQPNQWWFAVGAMLASCAWFPLLGYGARWLRPIFASPKAWQVLDVAIAVVMWLIAVSLIWRG
ncbi:MAG: LysE/ArgO family amino acid transporter [Propionibacteriaceae bacterium]|nr:LysE/ArgO family amino acid transporter [Propionibacteriaceae bacterium]